MVRGLSLVSWVECSTLCRWTWEGRGLELGSRPDACREFGESACFRFAPEISTRMNTDEHRFWLVGFFKILGGFMERNEDLIRICIQEHDLPVEVFDLQDKSFEDLELLCCECPSFWGCSKLVEKEEEDA